MVYILVYIVYIVYILYIYILHITLIEARHKGTHPLIQLYNVLKIGKKTTLFREGYISTKIIVKSKEIITTQSDRGFHWLGREKVRM